MSEFAVALTGGIASGKSTVADLFAAHGIHVIDADVAAREVLLPGTSGFDAVVAAFGDNIRHGDGLDRQALRERIFADADARRDLEAIVHPRIRAWMRERFEQDNGPYALLAIPLLAETWPAYAWVNRVLVVDAPRALRLERLMQRDGTNRTLAERMLDAQASRAERLARADDVLTNAGPATDLDRAVEALHHRYLALAGTTP